jgi:hypothetical protein
VPKRSLSWVHTPPSRASAQATSGQSSRSRSDRARASSSSCGIDGFVDNGDTCRDGGEQRLDELVGGIVGEAVAVSERGDPTADLDGRLFHLLFGDEPLWPPT